MAEPESSRSIPQGAYDVFLSFRGEDTRKTFTDHLYAALDQAGIHTFRDDDELPRGEEISEHLLKAIRESKISIVVFSKGYASSRWCLNELVEILKCKNGKTGQIVLPIFYDIDPSDVRKQTASFAEAFVKHEERFEEKLVKEWRKALEDAGNLSGRSLNDMANGHEAKFIKEIIKDVLNKLEPKYLYVPEHPVGMDRLSRNIFDFLSTATDDVRIVGIHGMPGIGKTTIAEIDIACFFIGIEKEYVAKVLEARCRYNPEVVLETLRERSLIQFHGWKIKDERPFFEEMVTMHDLLRDMGREVVCKASPWHLGKRTRIWIKDDAWNVLGHHKGTDVVGGLALDVRASEVKSLSAGSFARMKCLNLLQINGAHLTGSFKLLSKELMWICWLQCPLKYLPSDFTLDNLAALDMQYSNLKELWKGEKILNRLKILNLSHSQNLLKTPNLHSSSLEKLILEGCSSLVEVHQSIGNLTSLDFLNLKGCWSLKALPESIGNVKSLECLNISGCSQLEKLPERMGDVESLTELLADGIENEKCLSLIGQLKDVRRLSLGGYSSPPPSSSLISTGVLNWKRWLPASFSEWISVKCLELSNCGLSDRATSCVDFSGLSALEKLDLNGNKFSSLPSGIGFLPKLSSLFVHDCNYLVSIPDLPSSLEVLDVNGCKSLERVRIPIQSKKTLDIYLVGNHSLEEIQGIEGCGWRIDVYERKHSLNKSHKSIVEAMCNGHHRYSIHDIPGEMPNWMSYRGEGCSLSFHMPPVFQGLVLWFVNPLKTASGYFNFIIRNKSNGIQLLERKIYLYTMGSIIYVSRSEMAMGGDDELELECSKELEFGVHVIAGKSDSFEELEVGRDKVTAISSASSSSLWFNHIVYT